MRTTLKRGDLVICHHYKTKPICKVQCVVKADKANSGKEEIHIIEVVGTAGGGCNWWWGPRSWFRKIRKASPKYKIVKHDCTLGLPEYQVKSRTESFGTFPKRKFAQLFIRALKTSDK